MYLYANDIQSYVHCLPTGVVTGSSINDDCGRSIERLDERESTEAESRQDAVRVDWQGVDARQN